MQRYPSANSTSGVNNNGISGRDSGRTDSSSLGNYSINSRRSSPPLSYKLKCERESLNSRLGPPDFIPRTSRSAEENLPKAYMQYGYKATFEGLEEAKEIELSQIHTFSKPVVLKCKEGVRKCLRTINESRTQKRKAGQVYGVPLSGSLLCKPGFPELRPREESRKKWFESLAQPHKRLRSLADHIPGCRKKSLFEALIKNNVPLHRATWFVKVTYLNQVRPNFAAPGTTDKTQFTRCDQWTKDVIEYLQNLLDELLPKNDSYNVRHTQGRSIQKFSPASAPDGDEPSLHFKWLYMVRLLQWCHSEGLLLPNLVIDWVLKLLQEKEVFEILQLLLHIVYGFLECIVLSQTYTQSLMKSAIRFIEEPAPGGSDLVDNSRRAYTLSALIEMVRYLILATPDTFVASGCFPLPPLVASRGPKAYENLGTLKSNSVEVSSQFSGRGIDSRFEFLSFDHIISTIQRSSEGLAKIASAGYPQHNVAKAVQALDKVLLDGDTRTSYCYLFEDLCNGAVDETWIAEISPCLRSSLRWIGTTSTSFICSIFFLLEWATCGFRDFRTGVPKDVKFTGKKDYSQVYLVIQLLKQKILGGKSVARRGKNRCSNFLGVSKLTTGSTDVFETPGPIHDIIVCWIDQHEVHRGGIKHLQLLVFELIRSGIFNPVAYVRQLIVSGMVDTTQSVVDRQRRMRHHRVLKQLTGTLIRDTLVEARILEEAELSEAVNLYSNERHLLLQELLDDTSVQIEQKVMHSINLSRKTNAVTNPVLRKHTKSRMKIGEVKESISALLQFPGMSCSVTDSRRDDSQGSITYDGSAYSKLDQPEATSGTGCVDCRIGKKPKLNDEKSSCNQGNSPIASDDEDNWWMRKGFTTLEPTSKIDTLTKFNKQVPRGKQKTVRKMQSLAQLQAARIEGSQGASTSHVCDNKVNCPHHGPGVEPELRKVVSLTKTPSIFDIVSIGKSLKQLRFVDKRSITVWLETTVRQLIEESEKNSVKAGQLNNRGVLLKEKIPARWKLGVQELSAILYLMDVSLDLVSAVKFLLWLLPKTNNTPNFTVQSGRNLVTAPRTGENNICDVAEAALISSLRRYENILFSADLVPEALSALMTRAASSLSSSGKLSCSAALSYGRYLLKRYGSLASVMEWQKSFKANCDKRLISELDHTRSGDGVCGISLGVPAGVDNPDDYLRQKISGTRPSRVGLNMRDVVQRHVEDASHSFRKLITMKSSLAEKFDDGFQVAQQIVVGLMECIRQTGGAAQEGDPTLVSSAVSAVVNSIGNAMARISDFSGVSSINVARYIIQIHVTCLCLLKEALGDRQSRVFEIALATESSTTLAAVLSSGKGSRNPYQLSPESYDLSSHTGNEVLSSAGKFNRAGKVTAAMSALVIGAINHGVITLERIVSLLRLKEHLDFAQFVKRTKSSSNGGARSLGGSKVENPIEVYVHWFRLLVGNCKTVVEGLVLDLVGESSVVAIARMQRMLPLNLVFPPAYSLLGFVLWRSFVFNGNNSAGYEDTQHRIYQSLTAAINDVIKHLPFRDVCLRDTQGLYELIVSDTTDAEFASMLDSSSVDIPLKFVAFAPLRSRVFLNGLVDCEVPISASEAKQRLQGTKLVDKIVSVLDSLQPAKFHWQWVELRLLLNEQALVEKLENHEMSLRDAIRSSCPSSAKPDASENEKNFIQILLTRLLVRPDAVPLFSEIVHLFGRSVEDSMLKQAEWFLAGQDVLFGRKTIRQKLFLVGESKGLPTKTKFWKPWGWCISSTEPTTANNRPGKKRKHEITSIEEGEVVEDRADSRKLPSKAAIDDEISNIGYGRTTEKAFVQLVLPCIDQSSDESRSTFVNELVRQFSNIEQQLSSVTRSSNKHHGASPGSEISSSKGNHRKGLRGSSPNMPRRSSAIAIDNDPPPSPTALRASMSLRLHFLLRLLPVICRGPSGRNTRNALASTIVRLLGSRVVYEDSAVYSPCNVLKTETESTMADLSSEVLFDRLLFVLHGLLSNQQPSWLKPRSVSNSKLINESSLFDHELAESLQTELDRMQLPDTIRWWIQAAIPILLSPPRCSLSCKPPTVHSSAVTLLQSSSGPSSCPPQRNPTSMAKTGSLGQGKVKQLELETIDVDPWTLLEDGTSSGPQNSDVTNLRAINWLKGAVRVRRTNLTYIGSMDEDS